MNQIFQINILNVLHDVRQVMQITNVWVSLLQDIYTEHTMYALDNNTGNNSFLKKQIILQIIIRL